MILDEIGVNLLLEVRELAKLVVNLDLAGRGNVKSFDSILTVSVRLCQDHFSHDIEYRHVPNIRTSDGDALENGEEDVGTKTFIRKTNSD